MYIYLFPGHNIDVQINILHIRALVKADTVVLFDSYGSNDSRLHSVFLYHLEVNFFIKNFTCVGSPLTA